MAEVEHPHADVLQMELAMQLIFRRRRRRSLGASRAVGATGDGNVVRGVARYRKRDVSFIVYSDLAKKRGQQNQSDVLTDG